MQDSMKVLMPLQNTTERLCMVAHNEMFVGLLGFSLSIHAYTLKFEDYIMLRICKSSLSFSYQKKKKKRHYIYAHSVLSVWNE